MGTPPYDYPLMSYPTSYVYGVDMYGGYVDIDQFYKHVSCMARLTVPRPALLCLYAYLQPEPEPEPEAACTSV